MFAQFFVLLIVCWLIWLVYRKIQWNYGPTTTFKGKTVLITGASSGIGEALVKEMCNLGAK